MNQKHHNSISERIARTGLLVTSLLGFAAPALADMNSISRDIWRMKYGVTAAQVADNTWMNSDSDGDGIKNKDEIAAGTDPFNPGSTIGITSITSGATTVDITFSTEDGKQYVVQGTPALGTAFANTGTSWIGTGVPKTLTVPKGSNQFFRILVQDTDSDNDGASDWAEKVAGYDPNNAKTNGLTKDGVALASAIATSNVVTVTVTKASATQPANAASPVVDTGSITVTRNGQLTFSSLSIPLQKAGTATEGTDYDVLAGSVTFVPGATQAVLPITPKFNAARRTNVTAIVKVLAGVGYTLGASKSGSVVINPAGIVDGIGLTGNYQNTSSSTYATQQTIFTGGAEMTRTDATVDFATGVNGWGSSTGPVGMSAVSSPTYAFSVRWTGQILPQYSEKYYIDFRSDDSAKVWVNGVLLIDRWTTQGATDYVNSINLTAGVLYDIQIDYWNNAGSTTAEAHLYWWSASQPKQIIPTNRLFPAPTQAQKTTAVTNALTAVGYVGVPLSFSVVTPNISGAVTYALDADSAPLPPGSPAFALNGATGQITGTPYLAGTYNVAINALNSAAGGAVTGSSIVTFIIYPTGAVSLEIEVAANGTFTPDGQIPSVDDDTDYAAGTNRRLRGYIVPPKTGNYYFWLAANNSAELWISNDSEYVNRVRRASLGGSTGKKIWNAIPTQQTQWLYLVAGQRYYFDILHIVPGGADDYVALGWCQDDIGTVPSVVGDPNPTGVTPKIPNGGAPLQGYPLSGTVPSYVFRAYDYPTSSSATGGLFAANLGPQGSANTKASGSANLRTTADSIGTVTGNSAVLHFTYQGLGSPRTAYHLHSDAFGTHPAGEIIFDIDDADMFHPELRTADGGYIWNFEPVGTFTVQDIRTAITQGKVYLNIHSVTYPGGEIRGNLNLVKGSQTPPDPTLAVYTEPARTDVTSNNAHVARFLNQATFGATPADIAYVKANGFEAWVADQLAKPSSKSSGEVVANVTADINTPYPSSLFTNAWWKYSIAGPDQLRQRLAFALSEIMVASYANDTGPLQRNGRLLAAYYDNLVDFCLPVAGLTDSGNFKGVLKGVTLTPAMGLYLDMRGNQKEDLTIGRHPNENYAREIMQLFSVGLNRTWDDGKFVLNSNAEIVPTYDQRTILGLSALLTGWNYAQPNQANGRLPTNFGPAADYLNPMVLVPSQHDFVNAKLLLDNVVTPAATGLTPRVAITSVSVASPSVVNTTTVHGLKVGDTVRIANVTGGTFSASINATHVVSEIVNPNSFKVGAINCTVAPTSYTNAVVTGATVTSATFTTSGLAAITGSQADSSGTTLPHPYDQYGLNELDVAINNIVANDNVAPYVCRQLIQRLVTSNPSPGYLYRVVQKFKNNGSGVRGDMAAVIKQVLLDGEARSYSLTASNNAFGKQREPMLRLTGPARAFPAIPYSGTYTQLSGTNSNKIRLVTSIPNDFNSGFTVSLDFHGNYSPAGQTVTPGNVPTSTTYSVNATLGIAATHTDLASIGTGSPTVVTTVQPHGLSTGNTVTVSGVSGTFTGTSINSTQTATVLGPNSIQLPINTVRTFQVASIAVGTPCTVTTVAAHGLTTGNSVTLTGINGGFFTPAINGTFTATVIDGTTFTVPSNCTSPPTSYNTPRLVSNPCRVTTVGVHGLTNGDTVTISGVSGGSFSPTINNSFPVTVVDSTSFTLPVSCTAPSTINTGSIVGGNTMDVTLTGMVNVTYSQPAGSNVLTVNTGGPQTNVAIPSPNSTVTTLKSKAYLSILTRTSTAGIASTGTGNPCTVTTTAPHGLTSGDVVTISGLTGGTFNPSINSTYNVNVLDGTNFTVLSNCIVPSSGTAGVVSGNYGGIPASGVYDVQTNVSSSAFAVTTADTPIAARSGSVIVPKISTSYTPMSSNTVVQYNTNVNHNLSLSPADHIWVDVPVVGSPVTDAEYVVATITDEDHFTTSYLPVTSGLGTYPKPSGANNGITIFPLVAPITGRSGIVTVNQSTFNLGSTEGSLTQTPLNAPTVFNYFFPDYKFPGVLSNNRTDSPEFQLTTDTNISNLTNSLTNMFIGTGGGNGNVNGLSSFNNGNGSVVMDIGPYVSLARTSEAGIPGLVDDLANLLVGAPLETATRTTIIGLVNHKNGSNVLDYFPLSTPTPTNLQMRDRVRAIIHLIITSAEYAVQK